MLEAIKDISLKLLGALIPTILGWVYKAEWISARIKLRVGSEGEGITVQGGELPYLRVWLQVTNLSPFTIELDRLIAQVQLRGAVVGEFVHIHRHTIKPSSEEQFLLEGNLSSAQMAYLVRQPTTAESMLYLAAYINCDLHNLEVRRNVQTSNVRYLNCAP
jgi:hypothetical protein